MKPNISDPVWRAFIEQFTPPGKKSGDLFASIVTYGSLIGMAIVLWLTVRAG